MNVQIETDARPDGSVRLAFTWSAPDTDTGHWFAVFSADDWAAFVSQVQRTKPVHSLGVT